MKDNIITIENGQIPTINKPDDTEQNDLSRFFLKSELIPAIVQDQNRQVLMLAYMNEISLNKTLESGITWFYSRSRQELWNKGATSGHYQHVLEIAYDCDCDTLLITVKQDGAACHTGEYTCFFRTLYKKNTGENF